MPYIGTTPTKVVSRQSANVYRYTATAGQSVFTGADLDNNVLACNPADMIVHMNGLRLESTDYTATSTTVTLTTAATAGDEVTVTSFVTFEVADTYTKTAADDRYVNTTGDTMTGTLDVDASVFGRSFEFRAGSNALTHGVAVHSTVANALQFNTQSVERMRIDEFGRVTMPYQPAFKVGMNANTFSTGAGSAQINYDYVMFDRTNSYSTSTGRYTCPVSGVYVFTHNISARNAFTGAYEIKIFRNGVEEIRKFASSANYGHGSVATAEFECVANDYIEARGYWGGGMTASGNTDLGPASQGVLSFFSGHLIG